MEYIVGVALALGAGLFTTVTGFDRDRSLYPVILAVVASYYELFAVIGGGTALGWETIGFAAFVLAAVIGLRINLWIVVVALVGHGLFDCYHGQWIENAGVPAWWPMWCLSYDAAAGAYLAWRLLSRKIAAKSSELSGDPSTRFRRLERAHTPRHRPQA